MNELIKIGSNDIEGQTIQTVNARDLHAFLESKQQYADWIKDRIEQYDFKENTDFVVIQNSTKNPKGGRPLTDYHLSFDMAKEISMVERNDKGKQARQYFIECEKKLKTVELTPLDLIIQSAQHIKSLESRVKAIEDRPTLVQHAPLTVEYFTVVGHCNNIGRKIEKAEAALLGKACSRLSRDEGYNIGSVPDAAHGRINTYHIDILNRIVGD